PDSELAGEAQSEISEAFARSSFTAPCRSLLTLGKRFQRGDEAAAVFRFLPRANTRRQSNRIAGGVVQARERHRHSRRNAFDGSDDVPAERSARESRYCDDGSFA